MTIVGPAPAYTRRARPSSCYLVQAAGESIVFDMGQGSFAALAGYVEPSEVLAVFISHLHPDHFVDLVPLRHYLRYGIDPPGSVGLHAPADIRRRLDVLTGDSDFLSALGGDPLGPGDRFVGPFGVRVARVTHTDDSYAFRASVDDGPGVVYSGDCAVETDLLPLIRAGDTLLAEAAFGTREGDRGAGHLDARRAATAARDAGASRLILTHILDDGDPERSAQLAGEIFDGPVLLAEAGMVVELGAD